MVIQTTKPSTEEAHVWTDENLSGDFSRGADFDLDHTALEGAGGGNFLDYPDTSVLGLPAGGLEMDMGFPEGDFQSPSGVFGTFDQAAQGYLSNVKTRRRPKALAKISEDDFEEGAEQSAYLLVMHFANKLLGKYASQKDFHEALKWFFTREDHQDLTFDLCCDVLRARPDVLRLRIQYEWWKKKLTFTGPFDFLCVGSPAMMRGETLFHGGRVGFALAREVWVQPGISTQELMSYVESFEGGVTKEDMTHSLKSLQERYILSQHGGWYFTGRNPMLMNMDNVTSFNRDHAVGGSIHWARLFAEGH